MLLRRCGAAFSTHAVAVGGLADVSLYDRSDGRQLPVYWHEGRAYVVGKPGNEYAVRIRNRQRHVPISPPGPRRDPTIPAGQSPL